MTASQELSQLYRRDLTRLVQELQAFPGDDLLWQCRPGIANSAGNLFLHLEGNLLEFIGRQLGGIEYQRRRELEFASAGLSQEALVEKLQRLLEIIPSGIAELTDDALDAAYPQIVLGTPLSTRQFLIHLN